MLRTVYNPSGDCTILNFNMSSPRYYLGKHVPQTDIVVLINLQEESLQEFNFVSKTLSSNFPKNPSFYLGMLDPSILIIAKLHPENIKNYDAILYNTKGHRQSNVSVIGESDVTDF